MLFRAVFVLVQAPGKHEMRMPVEFPPAMRQILGVKLGNVSREGIELLDLRPLQIVEMYPRNWCVPK